MPKGRPVQKGEPVPKGRLQVEERREPKREGQPCHLPTGLSLGPACAKGLKCKDAKCTNPVPFEKRCIDNCFHDDTKVCCELADGTQECRLPNECPSNGKCIA